MKVVGVKGRSGLTGDWIMTVVPDILRKREKSGALAGIWEKSVTQGLLAHSSTLAWKIP